MPAYRVGELAEHVSGTVEGDPGRTVSGVAPVDRAGPGDLTFVSSPRYAKQLRGARAAAVLVPAGLEIPREGNTFIRVPDPHLALGRVLELFFPEEVPEPSVDATAHLGRGVELGTGVTVGPHAILGEGVRLGDRSQVGAFAYLEAGVEVGPDCRIAHSCSLLARTRLGARVRLHPGVRLGTEGFGYAAGSGGRVRIPQVGRCLIGDDVEIGANSTVDRGSLGDTIVGSGTKIDNLVHIGHNVRIGNNCVIVAQVGIAGSVEVGHDVILAGQAGVADHLRIGDGARIAAQAGVIGDVPPGTTYSGYPARPHREALRASAALLRLPELFRRLRSLERRAGAGTEGGT